MNENNVELAYIPVGEIEPNSFNPQEMSPAKFDRLKQEISEIGFIEPIQVVPLDTGKYQILGGEHRWKAACALGIEKVPCSVLHGQQFKSEDLKRFMVVRLNVLRGKLDPHKFAQLYNELATRYEQDALQKLLAFQDAAELTKALGTVQKELKKVLPKALHAKLDEASKEAKSIKDLGDIAQMLYAKYGDSLINHNYMVLSHGGAQILYIQVSDSVKECIDGIVAHCRTTSEDINQPLEVLLANWKDVVSKLPKPLADSEDKSNTHNVDTEF